MVPLAGSSTWVTTKIKPLFSGLEAKGEEAQWAGPQSGRREADLGVLWGL